MRWRATFLAAFGAGVAVALGDHYEWSSAGRLTAIAVAVAGGYGLDQAAARARRR